MHDHSYQAQNARSNPSTRKLPLRGWSALMLWLIISMGSTAFAQTPKHKITGSVTSSTDNSAIPGASVVIKGTTSGTATDMNGGFTIEVQDNDVLVISFIGYKPSEIKVGTQTNLAVKLAEDVSKLDEIVVVGYGVEKKKVVTAATVQVKGEDIQKTHSLQVEQTLQGQTPGVEVSATSGQPGSPIKMRIRGAGTTGNSSPLYVVDGMPTQDISYLNPSDVETVDVLKDAASAAIYGTRGANGIVLITTRKGKNGQMQISYDGYYGVQNPYRKIPLLNATEYGLIMNEAAINSGQKPYFTADQLTKLGQGTNWFDEMFTKNAPVQNHSIVINGGTDKSTYSSSVAYQNQEGIVGKGKSQYERLSFRVNTENRLYKDVVKVGENLTFTHSTTKGVQVGNIYSNSLRGIFNASPLFPAYDSVGNYAKSTWNIDEANPIAALNYQNNNQNETDRILGNLFVEIQPIKNLRFRSDFGLDLSMNKTHSFTPVYQLTTNTYNNKSTANMGLSRYTTWNWENTVTYQKTIGNHNITLLAGATAWETSNFSVNGSRQDLTVADFEHALINNGTNDSTRQVFGTAGSNALLSTFGRVNYNFKEKYLFTATIRRDGSTRFGANNRYGYFPSVSAGWVLSEEEFAKSLSWLSSLKLRASWGQNGNQEIGDYAYLATVSSQYNDYYFGNDGKAVGTAPDKVPNPNLKWEASEQLNFGVDATLFRNLSFSFDWYNKTTKDWLIQAPVPDIAGTAAPYVNGGNVSNKGVEVALSYRTSINDISFGISPNFAITKNEVTKINNPEKIIHGPTGVLFSGMDEFYRAEVGQPIGYFYGLQAVGIFQNTQEVESYQKDGKLIQPSAVPGDVKFADHNNDGVIDGKDKTYLGKPNPSLTYGISLDAAYKGFDLSVLIQGVSGNQVVNGTRDFTRPLNNYTTDILDRWHGEGTSNTIPRVTQGGEANQNYNRFSSLYVFDAGFTRIKSVNLGYNFKTLFKNLPIQQVRLYMSATNLFTFTKYTGLDPEVGYGNDDTNQGARNTWASGTDVGYYPQPRTFLIGMNIKF